MVTSNEVALQFLNIEQPSQIKSAENRRLVRRIATLSRNKNVARGQIARPGHIRYPGGENDQVRVHGIIGSGSTDPFRTFPVEMEAYMYRLFDFMKQSLSYIVFPYPHTTGFHPAQMILHTSVLDARVLHSTLSICSFATPSLDKAFQVWGLDHRGRTIQLVNKSLTDKLERCSEANILAVAQMASIELARVNSNAWKVHMIGLRQLVRSRAEPCLLPSLRFNVSEIDFMGAYMFEHPPLLSSDDYQSSSVSKHNLDAWIDSTGQSSRSLKNNVLSKLRLLPETHVIGERLNSILAEMHVVNQDLQRYSGRSYLNNHINHILRLRRGIEFDLFSLLHEDPPVCRSIEYAYITALQIYFNRVFRTFGRGSRIPSRLAARLRYRLLEMKLRETDQWEHVSSLLLWISFVGGASCSTGALRMWYITLSSYIRSRTGLDTWERTRGVLEDRLYPTGKLAEDFREFWMDEGEDFIIANGSGITWSEDPSLTVQNSVDSHM